MTPEQVARIVQRRHDGAVVDLLRAADADFQDAAFERSLAAALRVDPGLVAQWNLWSGDQRWTPSAAVEGLQTAWITSAGVSQHPRVHPDGAAAVADFLRRASAWLARREVVSVER